MSYLQKRNCLIVSLLLLISLHGLAQQITFTSTFAPTAAEIAEPEMPFRDAVSLNGSWKFNPVDDAVKLSKQQIKYPVYPGDDHWESTPLKVPSPWNVNDFATENIPGGDFVTYPSYPKKWEQIRAGWLMRKLAYRREWKNKRLILRFDGVGGFTQVYLNKQKIAENFDVFLPFEVDITDKLKEGADNELSLWVADGRLLDEPGTYGRRVFVGGSFWGQHVRGIWQDVNLLIKPGVYIGESFVQPQVDQDSLAVTVTLSNTTALQRKIDLTGSISPWINLAGKSVTEAPEVKWKLGSSVLALNMKNIILPANSKKTVTLKIKVGGKLDLWAPASPNLYGLVITSLQKGNVVDKKYTRFGWRQFAIAGTKLHLNGQPIILKGDSWHFMGIPQMTRRYAWAWYTALKDANANAVRLHAQPYPAFYLDMADEMGICVLDETAMWASDGGPKVDSEEYWQRSEEHLKRLIMRDRNHPAVFGWSVCNENLAVTIGVLHSPEPIVKRQLAEINKWIAITKHLDPTRTWISGDGETNEPTGLPTVIGHYGDANACKEWSSMGKPWGIGESGMAYYGTPKQTAAFNGERSYQSQQGRMEGVAHEAIRLLNQQKKYKASYHSIFNIVWYGLKPLELGQSDTTRKPVPTDGIFFGPYEEGKGGVQPERLGPYTTTLNPGYDPNLPLYKTWPLFDAVKSSFGDTAILAEPMAKNARLKTKGVVSDRNLLLLSADPDSSLYRMFSEMGLSINKPVKTASSLMVIDGLYPPEGETALKQKNNVLKNGGQVLVWGVSTSSVEKLNRFLPAPVSLSQRTSTSFLIKGSDPVLNNLGDADFYFTELSDSAAAVHGLTGDFVSKGKTLLAANNTNWAVWNKQAEYLKTAAILRSEREAKPDGATLVHTAADKGGVYVLALDPKYLYKVAPDVFKGVLANLGVSSKRNSAAERSLLGEGGKLNVVAMNRDNGNYGFWIYSPRSLSNLLLEPDMPKVNLHLTSSVPVELSLNDQSMISTDQGVQERTLSAIALEKGWNHVIVRPLNKTGEWKFHMHLSSDNEGFLMREIKAEAYR